MENSLVRTDDVISRKVGDEIVIIKEDGLSVHLLNKTASFIWEKCAETCDPEKIAALLCERYEIAAEEALRDVRAVLLKLEETGLLKKCVTVGA